MASKIDYWYEHRDELPGLKEATLQSAEKYRVDKAIDAMEELYNDVVQNKNLS
jgi:hypothetical protein